MLEFIGTCVGLKEKDLEAYDDSEREIGYRTFRRHVGKEIMDELNSIHGGHPTIKNDWHISYSRGKWKGRSAVCMYHSSIHHLWYLPKKHK